MDELTSADIQVLIQAVESLVEQSGALIVPALIAGTPAFPLFTVVQALTECTNVDGHPPGCTFD